MFITLFVITFILICFIFFAQFIQKSGIKLLLNSPLVVSAGRILRYAPQSGVLPAFAQGFGGHGRMSGQCIEPCGRFDNTSFSSSGICAHLRESFIKAFLVQSLLVWIGTEIFSHFRIVTAPVIYSFWFLAVIILFIMFVTRFRKHFTLSLGVLLKHPAVCNKTYWIGFFFFFVFFIVPLLFIALYYPPSNGDSLGYHLLRVEHWIQNASVAHYPTPEWRQLYHQPFAEFIILHIRLLAGSDFWVNLVQFFAMIGSLITISLVTQLFGLPANFQILSSILLFSLPVGILQSTTTQTDYLASFFFLIFIYYVLKIIILRTSCLVGDAFWGALALGLGCLTKLTIAPFALPFCLWLAIIMLVRCLGNIVNVKNFILTGAVFVTIFLILHGPFWFRNYMVEGNILGHQGLVTLMKNDVMSCSLLASNIVRGLSNHVALPIGNSFLVKGITWVHRHVLGVSHTDVRVTMGNNYAPYFSLYENSAGNFLLFFLILFLIIYLIFNAKRFIEYTRPLSKLTIIRPARGECAFYARIESCPEPCRRASPEGRRAGLPKKSYTSILLIYSLCSLSGLFLFYSLFRWQVLLSRLDFPFFVAIVPLLAWLFYDIYTNKRIVWAYLVISVLSGLSCYWLVAFYYKNIRVSYVLFFSLLIMLWWIMGVRKKLRELLIRVLVSSCVLFSIPYVYFNSVRPLCENIDRLCASRDKRYFVFGPNEGLYQPTKDIEKFFLDNHISNIAIEWGRHYNCATNGSFEYPLRAMFFNAGKKLEVHYIDSLSLYARFTRKNKLHNIQAIVSWVGGVVERYGKNVFMMSKQFSILGETVECVILKNIREGKFV